MLVGIVYDYCSLHVMILSGEKRKVIFFRTEQEYQKALEMGMRIGAQVIFNNETDEIQEFF